MFLSAAPFVSCMTDLLTTKPGSQHGPSIKNPRVYETLRKKRGMSKERAARISNAMARRGKASAAAPLAIPPTGHNALFNQPGVASRRAKLRKRTKAPNYGARAGQVIAGRLTRGNDGKFSSGGGAPAAKKPAPKPKRAARAPKQPRQTPEQRQQARAQEQATNRERTYSAIDLPEDASDSLNRLGQGENVTDDGGLVKLGLAEQGADGTLRLTPVGRQVYNAAGRGDLGQARDTMGRARDAAQARQERTTAQQERATARQARADALQKRRQEAEARRQAKLQEPKKGGGGGSKKPSAADQAKRHSNIDRIMQLLQMPRTGRSAQKATDSPGDYLVVEDPQKPSTWHLQVKRNGTPDHRLMGAAWAALHGGYRGNTYQGPGKTEALAKLKRLYAAEKMPLPAEKSFVIFKDAAGHDRWLAISSTAYRDRDGEIVSRKALQQAVSAGDTTGVRGPLRFWHVPGLDIGDCDYQATAQDGRFLIESGTFRSPALAQAVKANGDGYQVSIGFLHPETQPDPAGVFHDIAIFERSIVPPGRAANPFTQIRTKEQRMLSTEKLTALKALLGETPELTALLSEVQATDKEAQERGTAYKEAPPEEITLNGVVYTVKATPPPAGAEAEQKAPMAPASAIEAGDTEITDALDEEEPDGDEGPLLTDAELDAIADRVLQKLMPALDLEKKMRGYVDEMKTAFTGGMAQKDAAAAQQAAQLATLQAAQVATDAQLKELISDQPAGGYRASQRAESAMLDAALKAAGHLPGLKDVAQPATNGSLTPQEQAAYKMLWGEQP
jgi:hypothetical protein